MPSGVRSPLWHEPDRALTDRRPGAPSATSSFRGARRFGIVAAEEPGVTVLVMLDQTINPHQSAFRVRWPAFRRGVLFRTLLPA